MPSAKKFLKPAKRRYSETARVPIGPDVLARKKLGTNDEPVRRPSPLSDDMKIAFQSASFGTTASASELNVIPNNNRHPSLSTASWAFRTQVAGSPPVSCAKSWI